MDRTDTLIARLAQGLEPVRRLRPPSQRAALWLAGVALLATALVLGLGRLESFGHRAADPKLAVELSATLFTGILAVIAAFQLSLPDRPRRWALLPLPTLGVWIASSGYSCWRHWVTYGPEGWKVGESFSCFLWIVGFGVVLAVGLMTALRRARPLAPLLPAMIGGLGVAALAAFLLQFFHPFDVTFMDLGLHLAGVATVVAMTGSPMKRLLG